MTEPVPPWYSLTIPKPLYESDEVQAYWDVSVYAEHQEVRSNRFDAHIINYKTNQVITLETSYPWIGNREKKSQEKKTLTTEMAAKATVPGVQTAAM